MHRACQKDNNIMKYLSFFISMVLFMSFGFGISHGDMMAMGKGETIPVQSVSLKVDYYAAAKPISSTETNQGQSPCCAAADAIDAWPFDRGAEISPASPAPDAFGGGVGALFITEPIARAHNSVLDSTTLLLLGLTLVALSQYFGRKRFKR
jgi:hypothetical protein